MVRRSLQTREKLNKYYKKRDDIDQTIEKLERVLVEQENTEAGDIIRSCNMTIEELAEFLETKKGHLPKTNETYQTEDQKEDDTEPYEEETEIYDEI